MSDIEKYNTHSFKILSPIDEELKRKIFKEFHNFNEDTLNTVDENGNSLNYSAWYYSDQDLVKFSLSYPEIVFELTTKTIENNFYKMYAKNGKAQFTRGRITFEQYDENKLKSI